jgi:hypothetical protein
MNNRKSAEFFLKENGIASELEAFGVVLNLRKKSCLQM